MSRNVAVLIGRGKGRTLKALLDASWTYDGSIRLVAASATDAPGLELAARYKRVSTVGLAAATRRARENELLEHLEKAEADLICLCGWMYILTPEFIGSFKGKILNVHPALLPAFPGKDPQAQALAAGVKITGTTVHFVDEGTDTGPIIMQESVLVHDDDTLEALSDRIREASCRIYPRSVALITRSAYRVEGRRVVAI